jgi:hypothetical protein
VSNEDTVRRYCRAVATQDLATAERLRHPRWSCAWPQSGERVTSSEAFRSIVEAYPGGAWEAVERRLLGAEDEVAVTPLGQLVHVAGAGDTWTAEWTNRYPDGSEWLVVAIVELKDGAVIRETCYWAPPFEAPAWRRTWVELEPGRRHPEDPAPHRPV